MTLQMTRADTHHFSSAIFAFKTVERSMNAVEVQCEEEGEIRMHLLVAQHTLRFFFPT